MPSFVWEHFNKLSQSEVQCKLCKLNLKYNNSTSSMINHLKSKHPATIPSSSLQQLPITSHFFHKTCDPKRKDEITKLVANFISTDMLPFHIVEGEGFRQLINYLAPGYKLPCANTIKSHCEKLYFEKKSEIKAVIDQAEYVSLTTDAWTSGATDSYMTVTAHLISEDWILQSYVLSTKFLEERHTQDELANQLHLVMEEWNLNGKVTAVVHDNATNVINIGKLCGLLDLPCTAHTLQLSVSKGLIETTISRLLSSCSRIVSHFKHSTVAKNGLHKKQEQMNKPQHILLQGCKTRWNSYYDMIERLIEQRWPVTAVLSDKNLTKVTDARILQMKDEHWILAEQLIPILKPLKITTAELSTENNVSASIVLPIMCGLVENHLNTSVGEQTSLTNFKSTVREDIIKRFSLHNFENSLLLICTILDPRYKSLSFVPTAVRDQCINLLESKFQACHASKKQKTSESIQNHVYKSETIEESDVSSSQTSGMAYLLGLGENTVLGATEIHRTELENYLSEKAISISANPLQWWKTYNAEYPIIAKLARQFLCIPCTSVPSERVFSCAGNIIACKRRALSTDTADMLIFLAMNKKFDRNHYYNPAL